MRPAQPKEIAAVHFYTELIVPKLSCNERGELQVVHERLYVGVQCQKIYCYTHIIRCVRQKAADDQQYTLKKCLN
jgi:hypothetical protein